MRTIKEIFRSHAVFDTKGRHVNGSDKESNHHYGDAYESLFSGYRPSRIPFMHERFTREDVKLVMEVGVADGACLCAWREVFPNATIVGMDIHPCEKFLNGMTGVRVEFYRGDQRVKEDCECAAADRQFDLIVDDATHLLEDTLRTLYWLWPFVKPGGFYVVEEWPSMEPKRIRALWPQAELIGTCGPSGQDEPLVVFRKPL